MKEFSVTLTGVTPLIMNANRTSKYVRDERNPSDTWKSYVWHDGKKVCLPFNCLYGCVLKSILEIYKKQEIAKYGGSNFPLKILGDWTFPIATEELFSLGKEAPFDEHVKHLEPQYGWKGACEAVVPKTLAADVREAMTFMGALVDYEQDLGDEVHVLIHSSGYYVHIGA